MEKLEFKITIDDELSEVEQKQIESIFNDKIEEMINELKKNNFKVLMGLITK